MQMQSAWHDLEQVGYVADLQLWRDLASQADRTLELGCGTGRVSLEIAGMTRLTALDHSRPLLRTLRHRAGRRDLPIETICADVADAAGSYDLVIAPTHLVQLIGGQEARIGLYVALEDMLTTDGKAVLTITDIDHAVSMCSDHGVPSGRRIGRQMLYSTELPVMELDDAVDAVVLGWQRERVERRRHGRRTPQRRTRRRSEGVSIMVWERLDVETIAAEVAAVGLRVLDERDLVSDSHLHSTAVTLGR